MAHEEEKDLIHRSQHGDREAFNRLVELYQHRIDNYAFSLVRSHDGAQDVVQEAFIQGWSQIRSFRGDSGFITWITRMTRNVFLEKQRKGETTPRRSLDALLETPGSSASGKNSADTAELEEPGFVQDWADSDKTDTTNDPNDSGPTPD